MLRDSWEGVVNLFYKIENILIVNKLNVAPIYLLFCVFLLFHLEDMLQNEKILISFTIDGMKPTCLVKELTWLKCCCSFSLVKLMQNCSKLNKIIIYKKLVSWHCLIIILHIQWYSELQKEPYAIEKTRSWPKGTQITIHISKKKKDMFDRSPTLYS